MIKEKRHSDVEIVFTGYEMIGRCRCCGSVANLESLCLEIDSQRDNHEYFCVQCVEKIIQSLALLLH